MSTGARGRAAAGPLDRRGRRWRGCRERQRGPRPRTALDPLGGLGTRPAVLPGSCTLRLRMLCHPSGQ